MSSHVEGLAVFAKSSRSFQVRCPRAARVLGTALPVIMNALLLCNMGMTCSATGWVCRDAWQVRRLYGSHILGKNNIFWCFWTFSCIFVHRYVSLNGGQYKRDSSQGQGPGPTFFFIKQGSIFVIPEPENHDVYTVFFRLKLVHCPSFNFLTEPFKYDLIFMVTVLRYCVCSSALTFREPGQYRGVVGAYANGICI